MAQFGLTSTGFVVKRLSDIESEIAASLRLAFGENINLLPEAVFGQLVGIFSEREALIWELGEAIYSSQYPQGAQGTSVDNILALNNLRRLAATPTVTSPTENGIPGLVLYGTPATVVPAGSIISVFGAPTIQFTLDETVTIGSPANAVEAIIFSNVPTVGIFTLAIIDAAGNTLTTQDIQWNANADTAQVKFSGIPVSGNFQITLSRGGVSDTTANIPFTANAAAVQAAIVAIPAYATVTVAGSFAAGFTLSFASLSQPLITIPTNTLGVTATPIDSVQASINVLNDIFELNYPYTDVVVSGNFTIGFTVTFGSGTVFGSNPVSGNQPQNIFTTPTNTLLSGITVTNINPTTTTPGLRAQAIGSATCTATGPNFVPANTLNVIGSPVSGWNSVTNPLDCITGTNTETDTEALQRRSTLLAAQANGPLQAIIERVAEVPAVTAAIGFENLSEAALQVLTFSSSPTSGSFVLRFGVLNTASIPFTATSSTIQSAIQALSGYSDVIVAGSFVSGFSIDYNGATGGQPQPLVVVVSNSLSDGGPVTITPSFGRPGKSFEIVVEGGDPEAIAQTIYNSKPAGIQSYGNQTVQIFDAFGQPFNIQFSRPTVVPFYVVITMVTDLLNGVTPNPVAKFNPQSVQTIQQDVVDIGNAFGIGGLIVGFGSNGLVGCFNNVQGIRSYTIAFDRSPGPVSNSNIQLQSEELPLFETFNVIVSYT